MPRGRDIRCIVSLVSGPTVWPVSRAEAKRYIGLDVTFDDALIDGLLVAARERVQRDSGGRVFGAQTFDLTFDDFPSERWLEVPRWPLDSVTSITSYDTDDASATFAASSYFVDTVRTPGRIHLTDGEAWPSDLRDYNAGVVRFVAGGAGAALTVSSVTQTSGLATVTTSAAHGLAVGDRPTLAGAVEDDYNGTLVVLSVPTTTTFTAAVPSSVGSPATGTMTLTELFVPEQLHLAQLELIAHWYRRRTSALLAPARESLEVPAGYHALLGDRLVVLA